MMNEVGYCAGIENYSRYLSGRAGRRAAAVPVRLPAEERAAGRRREPPDGSAARRACTRAIARARRRWSNTAFACPPRWTTVRCASRSGSGSRRRRSSSRRRRDPTRSSKSGQIVEQVVRPTGLVDPEVEIRRVRTQVDDVLSEINATRRARRARADHHAHQAHGGGSHRVPARARRDACATCTRTSKRWSAPRSSAICGWASSTCSSASTCCARVSTCPRCRWSRSSMRTRKASCDRRAR